MPALHCQLPAVKVVARLSDDLLDCLRVGLEMRQRTGWLYVREVILGRWPRLQHEDAQGWVGRAESPKDHPGGRAACMGIFQRTVMIEEADVPPAMMMSYSSSS